MHLGLQNFSQMVLLLVKKNSLSSAIYLKRVSIYINLIQGQHDENQNASCPIYR